MTLLQDIEQNHLLRLISWECSPLGDKKQESSVFRVLCTVNDNDEKRNCTLILKILKPDFQRNSADHYYYWKREALVYRSGLLNQLPPDIRAPKCYRVEEELADKSMRIWLEDLNLENDQHDWSFTQQQKLSYLLGRSNGAYLIGNLLLPTDSFLCRAWMRSWVEVCSAYAKPVEEQKVMWDRYLSHMNDKYDTWECYCNNRSRVDRFLETLDLLPRVFAHQDVHWDNFIIEQHNNGHESLLAIDWQFASISGVGEELGRMFGYALLKNKIPLNKYEEYKEALLISYLQGLRDTGWEGNASVVRYGFTLTAALRFIMVMDKLLHHLEESDESCLNDRARNLLSITQALLQMADESWDLIGEIS